jgi:hypothetical protein
MESTFRYDAFVSYRRSDGAPFAHRLRHRLQDYTLPRGFKTRALRIYVDSVYEQATADFFENTIQPALAASKYLIVIQTPGAAAPRQDGSENWVAAEIRYFRSLPQGRNIWVGLAAGDFSHPLPGDIDKDYPNIERVDLRRLRWWWLPFSESESELIKFLGPLHDVPDVRMPDLRRETERRSLARRAAVAIATLAAVAVLAVLVVALWRAQTRAEAGQVEAERQRSVAEAAETVARNQRDEASRLLDTYLRVSAQQEIERGAMDSARDLLSRVVDRRWEWLVLFASTAGAKSSKQIALLPWQRTALAKASQNATESGQSTGTWTNETLLLDWEGYGGRPGQTLKISSKQPPTVLRSVHTGAYGSIIWARALDASAIVICANGGQDDAVFVSRGEEFSDTIKPIRAGLSCDGGDLFIVTLPREYCLHPIDTCRSSERLPWVGFNGNTQIVAVAPTESDKPHRLWELTRQPFVVRHQSTWDPKVGSFIVDEDQARLKSVNLPLTTARWVFVGNGRKKLFVSETKPSVGRLLDLESGSVEWSATAHCRYDKTVETGREGPFFEASPDGGRIAIDFDAVDYGIEVLNTASGQGRCIEVGLLVEGARTNVRNSLRFSGDGSTLFVEQSDVNGVALTEIDVETGKTVNSGWNSESLAATDRSYVPAEFGLDGTGAVFVTADRTAGGRFQVKVWDRFGGQELAKPELLFDPLEVASLPRTPLSGLGNLVVDTHPVYERTRIQNVIVDRQWRAVAKIAPDDSWLTISPDWRAVVIARPNGSIVFISLDFSDPKIALENLPWSDYLVRVAYCETLTKDRFLAASLGCPAS